MTSAALLRRASLAVAALTLACGDSTGPTVQLSEAQTGDMLSAMSAVSSFGDVSAASGMSANRSGASLRMANATMNFSQTVSCPNGGNASVTGSANDNTPNTVVLQITQGFSGCAATSEHGRVWTFHGDPNIVTSVTATHDQATGVYSMTATQVGGIRFESDLGSGKCQVDLTFTMNGDANSFSGTLNGTACGHTIQQSVEVIQ